MTTKSKMDVEIYQYPKKIRILYIITQGVLGGPRTHINHLISELNSNFDISVAIGETGCMEDYLENSKIPVYKIPSLIREISPTKDFNAVKELVQLIRTVKPDIISTHSSKAGILGRIAAKICKVPVIFTAHGWAFTEGISESQRRTYIFLEKQAAHLANKIICVSEHDRQLALEHKVGRAEQLVTIQNAMPFNPLEQLADPGKDNPVRLIMVARFCEQKDHRLLFEALRKVKKERDFVVDLVGDGPALEDYKALAEQLQLSQIINFLGSRTDVPKLLLNAQIFLLVSKWEGFPRSILEAMRAGLPVIASDVGGTREAVIDGKTGFLIPRGNLDLLVSRIQCLIDDAELRKKMAYAGHQYFLKHFTFDRLVEQTTQVYYEVIEEFYKKNNKNLVLIQNTTKIER